MSEQYADEFDSRDRENAPAASRDRRKRRRRIFIVLGTLAVILGLFAGIAAVYFNNLRSSFDSNSQTLTDVFPESGRPAASDKGSVNILLLGSDKRPDSVDTSNAVAGGGKDERSDSVMLVNISGDRQHVTIMSLMRDLWVDIPGHGKNKLNAGYAFGGRKLEVQTIENLLQTRIDHVAIVDMESFKEFGDALGGLDVNVEKRTHLTHTPGQETLEPGLQHLDGTTALAFSRERYSYANGDYQRIRNQQAVLRAIMNKLISKDTLSSPTKIQELVDKTSPYMSFDEGFNFTEMAKLGFSARNLRPSDIRFANLPTAGTGWSADGQSIVNVDEAGLAGVRQALRDDTLSEWLNTAQNHEKG